MDDDDLFGKEHETKEVYWLRSIHEEVKETKKRTKSIETMVGIIAVCFVVLLFKIF